MFGNIVSNIADSAILLAILPAILPAILIQVLYACCCLIGPFYSAASGRCFESCSFGFTFHMVKRISRVGLYLYVGVGLSSLWSFLGKNVWDVLYR